MSRVIVLFNLKPGVEPAVYEAWAKSVDLPTVNRLGSIERFEVFKSLSLLGSPVSPPYQYIEIIDIKDMAAFRADVSTANMKRVAGEFAALADATFILTEKIEPTTERGADLTPAGTSHR